jgi:glycosyltransferase involved in cell wall biosynthesis
VSKTKIFFIVPSLRGGGAERVVVTLLRHFDRERYQITLLVVDTTAAVYLADLSADIELIDLHCRRVRQAIIKIIWLIWQRRPNVVFSTLGHLNLALSMVRSLLPSGVRYIARETNIVSCALQAYRWPAVWAWIYQWFYKRHDLMICQSRYMQSDLVERFGYPRQRTVVINNPVDVNYIQERSAVPLEHSGRGDGKIKLVAAGRISNEKGFDLLINAIALLANPRIHLTLLGEGPLQDELKQLAAARCVADQVEFVGFQTNPYAWFAWADAFVLSSRFEGFPNVVLEALACGTPVIATPALGGIREILDCIPACVIAEKVSAQSLADAITTWLAGDRGRVGPSAVAPYALGRIIEQYQQVLS